MRGELLPFWDAPEPVGLPARRAWLTAAERVAGGIAALAHLDAFVDVLRYRVGFGCDGDAALARTYVVALRHENLAARRQANPDAGPAAPLDEVVLPLPPAATADDIKHNVLAVVKAAHALEFAPEQLDRPHPAAGPP